MPTMLPCVRHHLILQCALILSLSSPLLSFSYPSSLPQEMIEEADKDGDGEVSEAEFLRIMKKTNMY